MTRYGLCMVLVLSCIMFLVNGCSSNDPLSYGNLPCNIADASGSNNLPSAIFAADKSYVYQTLYTDSNGVTLSEELVTLHCTGESWAAQPDVQTALLHQFEYDDKTAASWQPHPLNPSMEQEWVSETTTGGFESPELLWMHPIRNNQYICTEVAPFPEVQFPLAEGNTWTNNLAILNGWGIWNNSIGDFSYTVNDRQTRAYSFGILENVWRIDASAVYPFGTSFLSTYYHETYGFVELNYTNYANERLSFVLQNATYKDCSF